MLEQLIDKLNKEFPHSGANIYFFAVMAARMVEGTAPFGLNRKERFAILSAAKEILKAAELKEIEDDMKEICGIGMENASDLEDDTLS